MKVNRILYARLLQEYDLLMMKAAYIQAERDIMFNPSLTSWQPINDHMMSQAPIEMDAETFHELHRPVFSNNSQIKLIEAQMKELEDAGRNLLDQERYELMQEAKEIWEKLKQDLNKLKNK